MGTCVVTEVASSAKCKKGDFGANNLQVVDSDGKTVRFKLQHSFCDEPLKPLLVWFDNPDQKISPDYCWEGYNIKCKNTFGQFEAKCTDGYATVGISAGADSLNYAVPFSHYGFVDIVEPVCQKKISCPEFNPNKRCYWELKVPCNCMKPTPPPLPSPPACINSTITFNTYPLTGKPIPGGAYVQNEWFDEYGISLSASGGLGKIPRIFDTNKIGNQNFGDPDLGTPNEKCGGPGRGKGGEPGQPGENCVPLGNVLIIQENNDDPSVPDDEQGGGTITMDFTTKVQYIYEIGIIDIEASSDSYFTVVHGIGTRQETKKIDFVGLGDNAVQTIPVNIAKVSKLTFNLDTSGAITHLAVCLEP
jgi:hypothetical protein